MGLDYDQLFPGRFLKSGEFQGRNVTLTIKGVRIEELPQDKGGTRTKGIIGFQETPRELVLNRTNGECIKGLFGRNTDDWIGHKITLYPAPFTDSFTGEQTTAIRVKGSPELQKAKTVEVRLPKRAPIKMVLEPTGKNGRRQEEPPLEEQDSAPEPGWGG